MTDKEPQPLKPIQLMFKGNQLAKMSILAMQQGKVVKLRNGLILNSNGQGKIDVDLKLACEFNQKWAAEHPIEAAEYETEWVAKYETD